MPIIQSKTDTTSTVFRDNAAQMQTLVECPECFAVVTWRRVPEHADWHESEQEMLDLADLKDQVRDLGDSISNIKHELGELDKAVEELKEES